LADIVRDHWPEHERPAIDVNDLEDLLLLSEIGRGGMGIVYRALQKSLNREVAVKLLDPSFGRAGSEWAERFYQEVLLAAALNHRNIAHIHWVRREKDLFYFVMELVDGPSLADLLSRRPLGLDELVAIFSQVCDGLQHAHDRGVIHRDLKPGNILLETLPDAGHLTAIDGPGHIERAVVVDFGLAARAGDSATSPGGSLMGTPAYMSPEQVRGRTTDHRCDVYSLGVTLYEGLTGRVPFSAPTPVGMASMHDLEEPPDPRELVPEAPNGVAELILRMLRKEPSDRPQSATDVKAQLNACLDEAANPPPMHSRTTTVFRPRGLRLVDVTVLVVDVNGFLTAAVDQPLARTSFLLESWYQLVGDAAAELVGRLVRRDAAMLTLVFSSEDHGAEHAVAAVEALRRLVRAVRDFNRTHGRSEEFTAGLETGPAFFGDLDAPAQNGAGMCFGRVLQTAEALARLRECGVGVVGPRLTDKLSEHYPLEPLIGVAEELGQACRISPTFFEAG
jgi:serine/threonine protein kinase